MPVSLSKEWLEKYQFELNADELKVYLHLSGEAKPRAWSRVPDPPQFGGETGDAKADAKRYRAALGGLKLKDLVEVDGEGQFRLPYLSTTGIHEASRQLPSLRERSELWQELQNEMYGALRMGARKEGFLSLLEIAARYVSRFDESLVELQKDGQERSARIFEELLAADRERVAELVAGRIEQEEASSPAELVAVARELIDRESLPSEAVWREIAGRVEAAEPPPPAGSAALSEDELRDRWEDLVARVFPLVAASPSKVSFLRLLQVVFAFATHRLPEGDPEEQFEVLRDAAAASFDHLSEQYVDRARTAIEKDAAESVSDADLLEGRAWEHARRLAAKHDVPVEVAMDHLKQLEVEAEQRAAAGELQLEEFDAPDISGLSKEEGEMAWIEALAPSDGQRRDFQLVLERLRRAKQGYLDRAIRAYCESIQGLLEEHGVLDEPTDEILDNIVATINEQTSYFRDHYFALTVEPVEPDDVRRVLAALASERQSA